MKLLEQAFQYKIPTEQAMVYYNTFKDDFTDESFKKQVDIVKRTSFKFPAIAAFYKKEQKDAAGHYVEFEPISPEESAAIRRTREFYER